MGKRDGSIATKIKERVVREFFRTHSYPKKNVVDDLITERPFDYSPAWEDTFFEAMRWSFNHHFSNCVFFKKLCGYRSFDASRLNSFQDVWDIPFILTDVFKNYKIETKTGDLLRAEFTSSGTSGKKSRIFLDIISGQRLLYTIYYIHQSLGLLGEGKANYLLISYNPAIDDTIGTSQTDVMMSYLVPSKSVFYALDTKGAGDITFLKNEAVENLHSFVSDGSPIRVLGFIHHICEIIKSYFMKYGVLKFPKDSFIVTGGGWKGPINPYGEDFDLFRFLKEHTTLDAANYRDLYTLNEHAVFYMECERHNKHIPNVSLACARSPRTLKRLDYGQTGLIHLYSPIIESSPLLSILTTDYGYVGKSCDCRLGGPYIKIVGRAGLTRGTTCAVTADKFIEKAEKKESIAV
jgi:hypothetical protein